VQLTEVKEHQDDILMIGGIQLFLPSAQEEAENSVVNGADRGTVTVDDDCQRRRRIGADI
jgi:hypothetical protein